jgi:REP element-mobilizing transposase RayT
VYRPLHKTSRSWTEYVNGGHRYEHWLIDNQVYFITAHVRDHQHAFEGEAAKGVFWDRFGYYAYEFGFTPWVTSLMSNHYHTIGYLREGSALPKLMQRLHGSVAKLVNDLLPGRIARFWRNAHGHEYFDGCIRHERQARRAYAYTLQQSERHRILKDYRLYPHTRVNVELERAISRALELKAFLEGVPYKRCLVDPKRRDLA